MPKIRKFRRKNYPSIQNKCNYCKNHPNEVKLPVLLRNHGKCNYNNAEHFEKCKPCLKNSKKTEKTRQWRKDHENSMNKDQNGN